MAERERSIRREDVDIIETYFPKVTADGKVAVVYETYFDVTAAKDSIEADSTRAMLVSLLFLLLVYIALHSIVARADGTMRRQYHEISNLKNNLEGEVGSRRARHLTNQQQALTEIMTRHEIPRRHACRRDERALTFMVAAGLGRRPGERLRARPTIQRASRSSTSTTAATAPTRRFTSFRAMQIPAGPVRSACAIRTFSSELTLTADADASAETRHIRSVIDAPDPARRSARRLLLYPRLRPHPHLDGRGSLFAVAMANMAASVLQRIERQKAKAEIIAGAELLSRMQRT